MKKSLYVVLGILFLTGCSITPIEDYKNSGKRFSEEYTNIGINEDNPMVYKTDKEIIDILKSGTGIIYFGFPESPWCQQAVPILIEVAKEMNIGEVYYFNPRRIRENNTDTYNQIVELLGANLIVDEVGENRLYVPDVYFVSDGNIIGHNFKTVNSQLDPYECPLTETQITELKTIYKGLISQIYNIECDC
ncbi:MAG: hypothetical protein PHI22_02420 [Bacilli bacterium]|nr:hypothetical protein [Bacilli bacterium]